MQMNLRIGTVLCDRGFPAVVYK